MMREEQASWGYFSPEHEDEEKHGMQRGEILEDCRIARKRLKSVNREMRSHGLLFPWMQRKRRDYKGFEPPDVQDHKRKRNCVNRTKLCIIKRKLCNLKSKKDVNLTVQNCVKICKDWNWNKKQTSTHSHHNTQKIANDSRKRRSEWATARMPSQKLAKIFS